MSAKIFPLLPRARSDRERLADVLGRKWLSVIERGCRDGDLRVRPKYLEEISERAMRSVSE